MDNQDDLDSLADSISDVVLPAPETVSYTHLRAHET